ncbi:2,3-dihydroxybiphenyl 1,2-dioxygenase [Pseudarthrobacter sp. AG30]|uniref:DODA-type extradiol aromatic ring-opening family dioxygenase n=1 Tax=Pseudarthrobacter sp. AG30 TaxID=2249742 RepID=UPI000D6DEF4E|nr:2,3-dihydroxybiphenyl 1,2-dioxygenase [Pseudarthrobacter sp. AG30]RAX14740.1 2,3-dihydroxybiphenyl 1,2-dioxygenase [Pseudarthrobacter sp. AG30]
MAKIVYVGIAPHDPTLPHQVAAADTGHPVFRQIRDDYERMRTSLAQARPDVIVMASGDHFNQWFYNNIPAFGIGKGSNTAGPFPWEEEVYRLPKYQAPGHHDLGRHLLESLLERHFDLASSDDYGIDHGFTVPLQALRPEQDIPVIPLWTNVLVPPIPPGQRYYDLGVALRQSLHTAPAELRVAVLATGHMTNSVGGPAMDRFTTEPVTPWDLRTWELFTNGRVDDLLPDCTWDKLYAQGNGTPGFMVHLVAWGVVQGALPTWCDMTSSQASFVNTFLEWDEEAINEGGHR